MENNLEGIVKKEIDQNKLEKFLKKVQNKIEIGVEVIGSKNEIILNDWLNEIKDNKSHKIIINYDEKYYKRSKQYY
jgi:hypothetical protein